MKEVFVDTLYWIAIAVPTDPWREAAKKARETIGDVRLVTTDEVLTEFLAGLSGHGEVLRRYAARSVRAIVTSPNVRVIPQSRDSFNRGLELYEQRPDKGYSLTDCVSMVTMKAQAITDVLTNDHHFTQEGFTILVRK